MRGKPNLTLRAIGDTIDVNLMPSFITINTMLPRMLQRKRGYIVSLGCVLGYFSPV